MEPKRVTLKLTQEEYGVFLCMYTISTGMLIQDDRLTIAAITLLRHQMSVMGDRFEVFVKQLENLSDELLKDTPDTPAMEEETKKGFAQLGELFEKNIKDEGVAWKLRGMFGRDVSDEDLH